MRRLIIIGIVAALFVFGYPVGPLSAQDQLCFPDVPGITNCISGRFREYWQQNGALAVFGYPISSATNQTTAEGTFLTQLFQRNRFELHPEKQRPYDVLLGRLGDDRLKQQNRAWQNFPKGQPDATHYFPETQRSITVEAFWQYWSMHGLEFEGGPDKSDAESLALFGMPISEAMMETNASGDTVMTQWFERARFECHPSGVLLGLLRTEVHDNRAAPAAKPAVECQAAVAPAPLPTPPPPAQNCDPSYPDFCIPPPPPDLDCPDISRKNFRVIGRDPHRFDSDNDGVGCENGASQPPVPQPTTGSAPQPTPRPTAKPPTQNCHPSYPTVCIPPPPPDLDCSDIPHLARFKVLPPDPHRLDGNDNDGIGCEGN